MRLSSPSDAPRGRPANASGRVDLDRQYLRALGHAVVPRGLPAQPAPYSAARPVRHGDVLVCGDHRDTGSIQGALVSGQRAAEALL